MKTKRVIVLVLASYVLFLIIQGNYLAFNDTSYLQSGPGVGLFYICEWVLAVFGIMNVERLERIIHDY